MPLTSGIPDALPLLHAISHGLRIGKVGGKTTEHNYLRYLCERGRANRPRIRMVGYHAAVSYRRAWRYFSYDNGWRSEGDRLHMCDLAVLASEPVRRRSYNLRPATTA